jgi:hypothetical protein
MAVAFKNSAGQTFTTVTVGPLGFNGDGILLQQQTGLVPAGTTTIAITLSFVEACENAAECAWAAADDISVVLNTLGTSPGTVLGTNLIVNGNAEAGPGVVHTSTTAYVPGWSTANGAFVAPYGGTNWIATTDPGPADRGVNLFCGPGSSYQYLDVSPAASLIDAGQVTFVVSAWLGSLAGTNPPTLTFTFFNWAGTRLVHIVLTFPGDDSMADDISFTLAAPSGPPVITPGGIVSASSYGPLAVRLRSGRSR